MINQDKIRVAFICPGGVIRAIKLYERSLASKLIKMGFHIRAYTSRWVLNVFMEEKKKDFIDGIEVVRYDSRVRIKPKIQVSDFFMFIHDVITFRPILIHLHFPSYMNPNAWITLLMKKLLGVPYVITLHNVLLDPFIKAPLPHTWSTRYDVSNIITTLRDFLHKIIKKGRVCKNDIINYMSHSEILHADKIVALTSFEKYILINYLKIPENKITVIPNAVDKEILKNKIPKKLAREKIGLPKDKFVILYLAQIVEFKGPQFLVEALKYVLRENKDVLTIFAGYNTKLVPFILKRSKELGISDKVLVLKRPSDKEKFLLLSATDIYVLPTLTEGFPTSVLEAMAFSKPIVVSNVTGITDVVKHMKTGILVKPADIDDLANAIIMLLKNNKLMETLGLNANKEVLKNYTWNIVAQKYAKLYLEIIQETFR